MHARLHETACTVVGYVVIDNATSGVVGGKIGDRKLQFSDIGDCACSKFRYWHEISLKWGIFSPKLCISGGKFSDKKIFRQAKI